MQVHVFRLLPGNDLRREMQRIIEEMNITGGWVLSAVGSLTELNVRFANREVGTKLEGPMEIVSLTGTLSVNGSHLHISVSDGNGVTKGGHLMDGSFIYTTAEIVIGWDNQYVFTREQDGTTAWKELQVRLKGER